MLREFVTLVNEAVEDGFDRGLNLFMEHLEEDLEKSEIISESGGVDTVIAHILESEGYNVSSYGEDIDESKIDTMLEQFDKRRV